MIDIDIMFAEADKKRQLENEREKLELYQEIADDLELELSDYLLFKRVYLLERLTNNIESLSDNADCLTENILNNHLLDN